MAPHHSTSDSESSDDESAPETISLSQSKKNIQKLDAEIKKAEIADRQSKRRQNRELDRKLKERADMNKNRNGKKKVDGDGDLEVRMKRAMREAREEMDEEGESGSGGGESDSGLGSGSENSGEDEEGFSSPGEEEGEEEEEEEGEEEEEDEEILPPKPKKKTYNPDYLPDELFTAAFASQTSASKRKATEDIKDTNQPPKKPKRSNTQKDLIVGSRAIRMLPNPGKPITPSAAPSSKVKKFLNRSLALKGGKQNKMWERRPANIGVLRRDGPASNFVRNR